MKDPIGKSRGRNQFLSSKKGYLGAKRDVKEAESSLLSKR